MPIIRIVVFNTHDNVDRYWNQISKKLSKLPNDVLVLPEAYKEGSAQGRKVVNGIRAAGAIIADVPYNDADTRKDRHHLVVVGNPEVVECIKPIQLVGRTALLACLRGGIDIIGVHLDDRQEDMRRRQTEALLNQVDPKRPTIIAGDMNSMHRDGWHAKALRKVAPLAKVVLPTAEPGEKQSKIERVGSLATRLTMMAEGGPIKMLERVGYKDADSRWQATKGFVQLDHILVPKWMEVAKFAVQPMKDLSDHHAIAAELVI
ncbi:MAG TPA: endonuclease/exonuclease/phosphatase family protein [Ktedonobacteraceae bacterium]|nr:endonuclease/exonuclease/phosphatase family protein [Ktedonobacteraceae bacterium]